MAIRAFHIFSSLLFACASLNAHAAELGEAQVRSHIGQQLQAEVELTLIEDAAAPVAVRLAHPDVYRGANIAMPAVLSSLVMQVTRQGGRQVLHLSSSKPVEKRMLHVYLELTDGSQRNVRLVTLWLTPDPNPAPPLPVAAPAPLVGAAPAPAAVAAPRKILPVARPAAALQQGEEYVDVAVPRSRGAAEAVEPPKVAAKQVEPPKAAPKAVVTPTAMPKAVVPQKAAPKVVEPLKVAPGAALAPQAAAKPVAPPKAASAKKAAPPPAPATAIRTQDAPAACAAQPAAEHLNACVALGKKNAALRQELGQLEQKVKGLQARAGGAPADAAVAAPKGAPRIARKPKPAPAPEAQTPWLLVGGALAAALALAGLVIALLRRRKRSSFGKIPKEHKPAKLPKTARATEAEEGPPKPSFMSTVKARLTPGTRKDPAPQPAQPVADSLEAQPE